MAGLYEWTRALWLWHSPSFCVWQWQAKPMLPVCWEGTEGDLPLGYSQGLLACLCSWAMRKCFWGGRWDWVTGSSSCIEETKDVCYCPSCRSQKMIAHVLLHFFDSVALVVSLRDVLHCTSSVHGQFRSRSSLLTPTGAATIPAGFFTMSWLWWGIPERRPFLLICHSFSVSFWCCRHLSHSPWPFLAMGCAGAVSLAILEELSQAELHTPVNVQPTLAPGHLAVLSSGGVSYIALTDACVSGTNIKESRLLLLSVFAGLQAKVETKSSKEQYQKQKLWKNDIYLAKRCIPYEVSRGKWPVTGPFLASYRSLQWASIC